MRLLLPLCIVAAACAGPSAHKASPVESRPLPEERHLSQLRQLTFGGENAEAYWSFDGKQLSLQSRAPDQGCDRIYRMDPFAPGTPALMPVSNGQGATTCAHYLPGEQEILYASTHLGGPACPPKPDMSQGYVWALYDTYDMFKVKPDGTGLVRLTETPGYDAEGTVCAKDGSIVFTSVRDGDIELYRMDRDGKNVRRLTNAPGYDGGAFFNKDCTKLVWRASRPRQGKELDDYRALLAKGLVRPSKLELYVANADGSDPVQVTYMDSATFAPFWHPTKDRILFSTNYPNPRGREFDIWAVNADGTGLERITWAPGFDGFPMFSPDGQWLVFSSNRATAPGQNDTNVFLAKWSDEPTLAGEPTAAERIRADVAWLSAPERQGRGVGLPGLDAAGTWLAERFAQVGLSPSGAAGFKQELPVTTAVTVEPTTQLSLDGAKVATDLFTVAGYSAQGEVKGQLVLAGYGLSDAQLAVDDYKGLDVKGKVVLVRRFVPETPQFSESEKQRRYGDIRQKAWVAKERGAKALVVVDWPEAPPTAPADWKMPQEARLPSPQPEGPGDAGIPVVLVKRAAVEKLMAKLTAKKPANVQLRVQLAFEKKNAFNVVGRLSAGAPEAQRLPGVVLVGAHYDHLGLGGRNSLTPDRSEPHLGADDNASGVGAMLEVARALAAQRQNLRRDVVFAAFTGEEEGLLGSTAFERAPPGGLKSSDVAAMLNMDMVGRLRENRLAVLGADSAEEWKSLLQDACTARRVDCNGTGDGYGPSDQTPFYAAGSPVLHFFTGAHSDYHKPSDSVERLNAVGMQKVAEVVTDLCLSVGNREARLTYKRMEAPAPRGDVRNFNASLGTVPDYAGPPNGQKGVLLSGVRAGGAAEKAGMQRGDILVKLGTHDVATVDDLMFVLNSAKPGETVKAVVLRDGKPVTLETTYQEGKKR